jgi:MFS family permease
MTIDRVRARIAVSGFFFLHGLTFGSWGARIPAIQEKLGLSEAMLGSVLFAIPIGQILSMPLAALLVARLGSRRVLIAGMLFYSALLVCAGLAPRIWILMAVLALFGIASNLINVALNTQAVDLETHYPTPIMASMHGLWSLAGFTAAAIGTAMIAAHAQPPLHFLIIFILVITGALVGTRGLLPDLPHAADAKKPIFALPNRALLGLGVIAFLSMISEGAMFDWSGVYFKKVLHAEHAWITAGYVAFMTTMAGTRFLADGFRSRYGIKKVLIASGAAICAGLTLAVALPHLFTAALGFFIVGAGVSSVVPLCFSEAGKTRAMAPSAAIAAVSTIGFFGFLIGPPLIGWVAGATSLRVSFAIIAALGLLLAAFAAAVEPHSSARGGA